MVTQEKVIKESKVSQELLKDLNDAFLNWGVRELNIEGMKEALDKLKKNKKN